LEQDDELKQLVLKAYRWVGKKLYKFSYSVGRAIVKHCALLHL
jgi:hypothetical protein